LVLRTPGRFVTKESVQRTIESILPPELLECHESDVFQSETFDSALDTARLNHLSPAPGPVDAVDDSGIRTRK
jgi:hypothetical protein